jgi:hypothetical protein
MEHVVMYVYMCVYVYSPKCSCKRCYVTAVIKLQVCYDIIFKSQFLSPQRTILCSQ